MWGPIFFLNGGLMKSKSCDSLSSITLKIKPDDFILTTSKSEIKVEINGEIDPKNGHRIMDDNYTTKSSYERYAEWCGLKNDKRWRGGSFNMKHWTGIQKKIWSEITCDLVLPPFSKYGKKEIPLVVYFIVDGKNVYKLEKTIRYLDDGEEFTFSEQKLFYSIGHCGPSKYFEEETLHIIEKKGDYGANIDMITVISREEDRYKIVTNSPPGNLFHRFDSSCKIPIPIFPENIEYVDLSFDLEEGVYINQFFGSHGYIVDDKSVGKFLGYTYEHKPLGYKKTISFQGCDIKEIDSQCYMIPVGVGIRFVDYPPEISNNYVVDY